MAKQFNLQCSWGLRPQTRAAWRQECKYYAISVLSKLHKEGRLWHFEQTGECENVGLSAVWLSVETAELQSVTGFL